MSPQNLTNVYNQNPTLQSSYTLQQYLDLFGGSSTPANTTTATTTTPTPTPTSVQPGIINQNINQYQGGGDGPQGDFGIFGNLDKNTAKDFNVQTYDEELGDFIDTNITGYKNVNSGLYQDKFGKNLQPAFSNKGQAFGLFGLGAQMLGLTPDTVGGYVPGSIKGYYDGPTDMFKKTTKFLGDKFKFTETGKAAAKKVKEEKLAKEIAEANKKSAREAYMARAQANADRRNNDGSGNTTNVTGFGKSGLGRDPNDRMAKGGVVSLKDGGSTNGSGEKALSAKVKELMDDGYEFGEAVKEAMKQGYMNGGRIKSYFKGGLVSLRGK